MIPAILTTAIFAVLGAGAIVVLREALRSRPAASRAANRLRFRWHYALLPLSILGLTIVFAAIFYPQLPAEVAYNFRGGAAADSYFSRQFALGLMLSLQLILLFPVAVITWGATRIKLGEGAGDDLYFKVERALLIVTNLIALPQSLACFALADIFSYNISGAHLPPLWLCGAIVFTLGTVFLVVLFFKTVRQTESTTPDKI